MKLNRQIFLVFVISSILFAVPFFWLQPGVMDLGGDSSRIYFYDPISSLKHFGIHSVVSSGTDELAYNQYLLPYYLFLGVLRYLIPSATVVMCIMNGVKLAGSFLFVFLVIREFFRKNRNTELSISEWTAALVGSLFYTLSPAIIDNMRYALTSHDQIFLNPLLVFLILRYLRIRNVRYLWIALLITFVFSPNFFLAIPPFWAFYPMVLIFLFIYNSFILRKSFPWKGTIVGVIFFLSLNAFHIFPTISNIFDKGSEYNTRAFESFQKINRGLEYFNAILGLGKVSKNILLPLELQKSQWGLAIIPGLALSGLFFLKKKSKTFYLISFFFFTTLFLTSANITHIGVEVYRKLFSIPGFGMFRNFIGQWQWIHTFFYALFASFAISFLFSKMKKKYVYLLAIFAIVSLIIRSWLVFDGGIVNVYQRGSKNLTALIRMDPEYEKFISYIKGVSNDGRIFHMPFTDFSYNILAGANKGVYIGQSLIPYLTGRNDFPAYQNIDPFSEVFRKLIQEKNYPLIRHMMSLLQVRYVLYNSDEMVTDTYFKEFPYGYAGTPTDPAGMREFIENTSKTTVFESGHFALYEVNKDQYLPHFYIPKTAYFYDIIPKYDEKFSTALSFFPQQQRHSKEPRVAYIDRITCSAFLPNEICAQTKYDFDITRIRIAYQRITPTKYKLNIYTEGQPFILVFQNKINPYWKLFPTHNFDGSEPVGDTYFDSAIRELVPANQTIDLHPFETNGKQPISQKGHIQVNGYASAWYVTPEDLDGQTDKTLIVEMVAQKKVYISMIISIVSLCAFLSYGVKLLLKK